MLDKQTLQALSATLLAHKNAHKQYDNWPEVNRRPFEQATELIKALQAGNTIASLWSVEDVYSVNRDCEIEQISKDGEDDGLTWFHCYAHDNDTLDQQYCEDHPSIVTEEQARRVLQLAEKSRRRHGHKLGRFTGVAKLCQGGSR